MAANRRFKCAAGARLRQIKHWWRFAWMYWIRRLPWDSGISPPELLNYLSSHPPGRAIDLGCGTGTNVITLARHGWQVTGVDFIPQAIARARRKARAAGIQADLRVGDVTRLPDLSGPYDLALDIGCFHSLPNKDDYLHELNRLLAPGGHWLLYGFFRPDTNLTGPGLVEADLERILAHGFRLLSRTDGQDQQNRHSAWFLFQKPQ